MIMEGIYTLVVIGEVDQYIIMMMITLLFTVLALSYRKDKTLNILAGICWVISGIIHFTVGDITNVLTYTLPLLYGAVGLIFILITAINWIKMLQAPARMKRKRRFGEE